MGKAGRWVGGCRGRKAPASLCPCRGSSGVQNGLLVVNMLMDGHRGLAEQLASCDLPAVLQSCWRDGQSPGCPHATLALGAINRLAEHGLPLGPQSAGSSCPAPLCHGPAVPRAGLPPRAGQSTRCRLASGGLGRAHVSLLWQAEKPHWIWGTCGGF